MTETLEELITDAREGDRTAFRMILEGHQSYAYAVAFRFLGDEADAEDAVQEAFRKIWKHLNEFDTKRKFTTWMYRIVVNCCFDRADANTRRKNVLVPIDDRVVASTPADHATPESGYTDRETAGIIRKIADGLSATQQMIFILRDMQDLSVREVSEITGLSEGSVKTNLCYARTNIRKKLIQMGIAP